MRILRTISFGLLLIMFSAKALAFELPVLCQCMNMGSAVMSVSGLDDESCHGQMDELSNSAQGHFTDSDALSDSQQVCNDCACGHCSMFSPYALDAAALLISGQSIGHGLPWLVLDEPNHRPSLVDNPPKQIG